MATKTVPESIVGLTTTIASEARVLANLLTELVCECDEHADRLMAMQALAAKLGWTADAVTDALGSTPAIGGADDWLAGGVLLDDLRYLRRAHAGPV